MPTTDKFLLKLYSVVGIIKFYREKSDVGEEMKRTETGSFRED